MPDMTLTQATAARARLWHGHAPLPSLRGEQLLRGLLRSLGVLFAALRAFGVGEAASGVHDPCPFARGPLGAVKRPTARR